MSISEARRQMDKAFHAADTFGWNGTSSMEPVNSQQFGQFMLEIAHVGSAIVEAISENKPYDGTLNTIRVPAVVLRQILVDLNKVGGDEIGLEDLLISIKARVSKTSDLDNNT